MAKIHQDNIDKYHRTMAFKYYKKIIEDVLEKYNFRLKELDRDSENIQDPFWFSVEENIINWHVVEKKITEFKSSVQSFNNTTKLFIPTINKDLKFEKKENLRSFESKTNNLVKFLNEYITRLEVIENTLNKSPRTLIELIETLNNLKLNYSAINGEYMFIHRLKDQFVYVDLNLIT